MKAGLSTALLMFLVMPQTPTSDPSMRFTATSANVSGAGETVKINLAGLSTDAERDQYVAAWTLTAPAAARDGDGGRGRGGTAAAAVTPAGSLAAALQNGTITG